MSACPGLSCNRTLNKSVFAIPMTIVEEDFFNDVEYQELHKNPFERREFTITIIVPSTVRSCQVDNQRTHWTDNSKIESSSSDTTPQFLLIDLEIFVV